MRPGLSAAHQPDTWTDGDGITWKTSNTIGRIKFRSVGRWALRKFVYERDKFTCQHCGWVADMSTWDDLGRRPVGMTGDLTECLILDHIMSRCYGGSHHPDNLQCLCGPCNAKKGWRQ